ncbi:hypothetical protein LY76DRAFT_413654 [Colletotrichum caudatum]|nr:hypothetical protein LY76DRAFT_413654 [Colletotrichum caudatum]
MPERTSPKVAEGCYDSAAGSQNPSKDGIFLQSQNFYFPLVSDTLVCIVFRGGRQTIGNIYHEMYTLNSDASIPGELLKPAAIHFVGRNLEFVRRSDALYVSAVPSTRVSRIYRLDVSRPWVTWLGDVKRDLTQGAVLPSGEVVDTLELPKYEAARGVKENKRPMVASRNKKNVGAHDGEDQVWPVCPPGA